MRELLLSNLPQVSCTGARLVVTLDFSRQVFSVSRCCFTSLEPFAVGAHLKGISNCHHALPLSLPPSRAVCALSSFWKDNEERRKRQKKEAKRLAKKKQQEEQEELEFEDPEMAAMMGFGGFGGGSKKN